MKDSRFVLAKAFIVLICDSSIAALCHLAIVFRFMHHTWYSLARSCLAFEFKSTCVKRLNPECSSSVFRLRCNAEISALNSLATEHAHFHELTLSRSWSLTCSPLKSVILKSVPSHVAGCFLWDRRRPSSSFPWYAAYLLLLNPPTSDGNHFVS